MDPAVIAPQLAPLVRPITEPRPHPRNARNGDGDAIRDSLIEFGQVAPIVVQASTGLIVKGNHVHAEALGLRWQTLAQTWVDMDDETALRFLVADNRTSDLGMYDEGLLAQLLGDLRDTDQGLTGTGWTDDQFSRFLADLDRAEQAELDSRPKPPPVIMYAITFATEAQRDNWFELLAWAARQWPHADTVAEQVSQLAIWATDREV